MNDPKNNIKRLMNRLSEAHQSKEVVTEPPDNRWREDLMRSIRNIGPLQPDTTNRLGILQLTWRLAPAALALMILLAVLIVDVENKIEYQLAGLMMSDPVQTYVTYEPF
jgi:hypothetical protein